MRSGRKARQFGDFIQRIVKIQKKFAYVFQSYFRQIVFCRFPRIRKKQLSEIVRVIAEVESDLFNADILIRVDVEVI